MNLPSILNLVWVIQIKTKNVHLVTDYKPSITLTNWILLFNFFVLSYKIFVVAKNTNIFDKFSPSESKYSKFWYILFLKSGGVDK